MYAQSVASKNQGTHTHAKHCLVIFDAASSVSQWPALVPGAIRFQRSDATEKSDTITAFAAQRCYSTDPTLGSDYTTQITQLRMTALDLLIKTYIGASSARHIGADSTFNITPYDG